MSPGGAGPRPQPRPPTAAQRVPEDARLLHWALGAFACALGTTWWLVVLCRSVEPAVLVAPGVEGVHGSVWACPCSRTLRGSPSALVGHGPASEPLAPVPVRPHWQPLLRGGWRQLRRWFECQLSPPHQGATPSASAPPKVKMMEQPRGWPESAGWELWHKSHVGGRRSGHGCCPCLRAPHVPVTRSQVVTEPPLDHWAALSMSRVPTLS